MIVKVFSAPASSSTALELASILWTSEEVLPEEPHVRDFYGCNAADHVRDSRESGAQLTGVGRQ